MTSNKTFYINRIFKDTPKIRTMDNETTYNSARQYALSDIAKDVKERAYIKGKEIGWNMWTAVISHYFISASHLDTKENRRLNRELGLHKVNKVYRYQTKKN